MKKIILLFFVLILSIQVFAQLEVKEGSFKEVLGFVNINTDKMYDDNDRAYSVLKVRTENINDKERHQLMFEGDARTFFELEYKPGEVWVYISYYATYMKVSHPDFGSTEFWFPFDMQGKKGYELTLVNKPSVDQEFADRLAKLEGALAGGTVSGEFGYLVIKTTPVDGAMVVIDGEEMAMKTPFVSEKLGIGPHRVRVEKEFYKPYVTVVYVEESQTFNLDVELIKARGSLEIITHPDNANLMINKKDAGLTPQVYTDIPAGDYIIELNKKKFKTVVKDVVVKDGEKTLVNVELVKISSKKSLRKKGWAFRPEIGVGIMENSYTYLMGDSYVHAKAYKNQDVVSVNFNVGYLLRPNVYLGVGAGLNAFDMASCVFMPLYFNPRLYLNNSFFSVYFDLRLGLSFSIKQSSNGFIEHWDKNIKSISETKVNGTVEVIEFGFEFGHSCCGVAFSLQNIVFEAKYGNDLTNDYKDNKIVYSIMLKYGYSIFKK